ncbi:hypothetical protein PARU111607_02635 [Palleronia rufa]
MEESKFMSAEEEKLRETYLKYLGIEGKHNKNKRRTALDRAWSTRNFEIEMYWKRSIYFWGFQIVFLGSFLLLIGAYIDSEASNRILVFVILVSIALLASFFAFVWTLVERGSKDWQDNWERHIDLLGDEFTGALYKTYLFSKVNKKDGYAPYSVSKLNSLTTKAVMCFWVFVSMLTVADGIRVLLDQEIAALSMQIMLVAGFFALFMITLTIMHMIGTNSLKSSDLGKRVSKHTSDDHCGRTRYFVQRRWLNDPCKRG